MGPGWRMGWRWDSGRSLVCTDKGGEDAVLPAEQLLWRVELEDGPPLQHDHQVCTQDGVHAVLEGWEGLVRMAGERARHWGHPPAG